MLKGYKILTSFCVICATLYGGAYGAASVRGGATSRAGSIRTLGAGTTASVKTTTSRTQPTTTAANANTESTESVGGMRMSHATGLGGSKLPGKISGTTTSTSGDNQNVAELRQAIEQLRNDYDALGEQYNNLLGDVSNVSDTAQVAHETATNNTNTLTVVRSDLSVAKSDIEDLKATGGFDEERVQEALDTTLAQRNYATRGELAATDAVARGAVQVADLPQTLNALNIADKDYVASRTQGVVNDSLNITLENYYTKGQVNAAIDVAKTGMVDKQYVDHMVDGLAPKTYVDNRVASIQTGVSEGAVQGIIDNSIDTRLGNYYTKGDIDNAIVDAIGAAKDGMADRDFVNNQVRDTMQYVDEKVAEKESGVDAGTLYNILETRGYKTGTEVQGIVNDSINNTMANYYTKGQVNDAISAAKDRMVDKNYVDFLVEGLVDENRVNTIVNTKIATLPLGLDQNAVKAVVEDYGYKDDAAVRNILAEYNYAKADDIPNMIAELAPGADIQYDNGVLIFKDKNGNQQTVDIRDGQDGAQVEIRQDDGWIQWHYEGDTEWNNLVAMSDLKGADGESVKLDVVNNNLVWKKEGESGWQYLYDLGSITGTDGCGVKAETTNTANGMMVKLLKDCAGQTGDGQLLTQFEVLNGADGTVTEEQIVDALESDPTFGQLKKNVQDLSDGLNNTNSQVNELSDKVDNNTTGLAATNTLANKAWSKVEDLEETNKTAREYVDDRIGDLGFDLLTRRNYASVAAKLGAIDDTKTVAEYINAQISKINTSIEVRRDSNGYVYICNKGTCSSDPHPYSNEWTQISVDLTGYLTKSKADDLYAPISLVSAVDTAQSAATQAQTQASQAWGKLSNLDNLTVKDYVDNYVGDVVGNLGFNIYANKAYNVADKLGFTNTSGTVKEYIDSAVRSVNTTIQVDQYNGQTYICKKNKCTTPAGPYYPEDWAQITVDVSGYLTEDDAERTFATLTALNEVKTTANEAKTAANAAQTSATQAQNAANSAQSKADDALGKLNGLSGTVKDYVDEKVGSNGLSIRVEPGTDGYTYICTASNADCRDGPSQGSPYWNKIDFTIPSEYLTESEGDERYALKTQIGELGGSFTNVGAKIGLNELTNSSKTVKQYVDDRIGSTGTDNYMGQPISVVSYLSTNYTPLTKLGTEITGNTTQTVAQYITQRIGNTGDFYDSYIGQTRPKTVVEFLAGNYATLSAIGDLGAQYTGAPSYTVAQKIGLTDANSSKTVVQYIGEKIGNLGTSYQSVAAKLGNIGENQTVADYVTAQISGINTTIKVGTYGGTTYICKTSDCSTENPDPTNYPYEFNNKWVQLNVAVTGYLTKSEADGYYASINSIGNLGNVAPDAPASSVAAKLGTDITSANKTVAQYVGDKIGSLGSYNNGTYDVYYNVATKIGAIDSSQTVKGYVDAGIGSLGSGFASVASKLGAVPNDQTVTEYIAAQLATVSTSIVVKSGTDGNTYICTGTDCATHANDPNNDSANWTKLNVDLSGINAILAGFGGASQPRTVMNYIGDMGGYNDATNYGAYTPYTVASKIGLNSGDDAKKSVKQYIADRLGFTGDNADKTVAQYVAEHAASGGSFDPSVLNGYATEEYVRESIGSLGGSFTSVADKIGSIPAAQTIKEYIDNSMPNIDVRPGTADADKDKLYICTKPSCDTENIPGATDSGWVELDIAGAINLSLYLTKTEAASTYLSQEGIKLKREGKDIKIWGGGIAQGNAYKVADVEDLMCASYRMEPLVPGDEGYDANKASFQLICNTNE